MIIIQVLFGRVITTNLREFMKKFIESNVICLSTMIILDGKCERVM